MDLEKTRVISRGELEHLVASSCGCDSFGKCIALSQEQFIHLMTAIEMRMEDSSESLDEDPEDDAALQQFLAR